MSRCTRQPSVQRRYTRRDVFLHARNSSAATLLASAAVSSLLAACGGTQTTVPSAAVTPNTTGANSTSATPNVAVGSAVSTTTVTRGGMLRFGAIADLGYGSLDLSTTTGTPDYDDAFSFNDAYIYLLPNGTFVPGLATSWDVSPDGLSYTFKLRQDVKFHDGTAFDAAAAKYNFDRYADKAINPAGYSYRYLGAGVNYKGCNVIDPYTFRLNFSTPNTLFIYRMRRGWFSPQSPTAIQKYGKDYYRNPVSVGPFKFTEWTPGDHITGDAYADYKWGPTQIFGHSDRPYLDRIMYKIFKDNTTKATALESGDLDYASQLNPEDFTRFKSNKNFVANSRDQNGTSVYISCNCERPPSNDIAVRQAISWAIDRAALAKSLYFGLYPPTTGVLTPNMWSYDASLESLMGYDSQKAGQLLDQAGWVRSGNGTRSKQGQDLKLRWIINQAQQPVAQYVQDQLQKIGIAITLQTLAGAGLNDALTRGDHNLSGGTGNSINEDPDILRTTMHSSLIDVSQNTIRVRNPELDSLFEKGISFNGDLHAPEREQMYKRIQQIILQNAYVIPLYDQKTLEAYHTNVHAENIGYDPYGQYHQFNSVWLEKK